MTRPAHRAVLTGSAIAGASLLATLGGGMASCTSSTTALLYTPFTGLRLDSAALFAGYACGVGTGQVFAYEAIVSDETANDTEAGQPQPLPVANVYKCGTNAAFQNLPGSGVYEVAIRAYERAAFPPALACNLEPRGDVETAPGACMPPLHATDYGTPTWTTTCRMGIQEPGDNSLVVCDPLTATSDAGAPDAAGDGESAAGPDASFGGDAPLADGGGADATDTDANAADADASSDAADAGD